MIFFLDFFLVFFPPFICCSFSSSILAVSCETALAVSGGGGEVAPLRPGMKRARPLRFGEGGGDDAFASEVVRSALAGMLGCSNFSNLVFSRCGGDDSGGSEDEDPLSEN